jgi:transcriptional repressor NrdR
VICPYCGHNDDKVIDSRASDAGKVIRRRRECLECEKRYTTYERVEPASRMMVVKRDGRREPFDREKVLAGIQAAFGKRKTPEAVRERIADEVDEEIHREGDREVDSRVVGRLVLRKLREVDDVAYIRFASEYMEINTARELMAELEELSARPRDVKDQTRLF